MTDERIIAYLLKELPEDELEQFEDECFARETWPPEVSAVEEDLIDAYLRHELTPERSQRFEQNYLTIEGRWERVRLAAALLRHVDEYQAAERTPLATPQTKRRWTDWFRAFWNGQAMILRAATALLIASIVVGALWFFFIRQPTPRTVALLNLSPNASTRGEGDPELPGLTLPIKEDALKISLKLPGGSVPAARYRVVQMNARGETKPLEVVEQDSQSISVIIPAAQLQRGQYVLQVFVRSGDGAEQRTPDSYLFIIK